MAISITSFLKPSTSPNNHLHLTPNKPTLSSSSWGINKEEISWRRGCMATMACIVISSGTIGFAGEANSIGVSENSPPAMETALEGKLVKWSDQRRCPPWHANSLESVVPENLPRPFSRSDGHASFSFQAAPRILDFVRTNAGGCFSL